MPSGRLAQRSKVSLTPEEREGLFALNRGPMPTVPVKYSAGPLPEGCEPIRVILIICEFSLEVTGGARDPESAFAWLEGAKAEASRKSNMTVATRTFIYVLLSSQCLMVVSLQ
jgi:hypothetical protein